jgi:outer membrane protein
MDARFSAARGRWMLVIGAIFALHWPAANAQLLRELSREALALDPTLSGALAQARGADQRVTQARAGFGPTAAITASRVLNRYQEAPAFENRPYSSKQLSLQISQPVFRAALLPALEQSEALLEAAGLQVRQAQIEVNQRLVESCFDVFKARDVLEWLNSQRNAAREQLATSQSRLRAGAAPITDVREAEARVDSVAAQVIAAEYELELKKQIVAELVGHPVAGLAQRGLAGDALPVVEANSVQDWIATALQHNANYRQAQQNQLAAQAEIRKAQYAHAPTAELTYSNGMTSETGSATSTAPRRADASALALNVNIPLFASGSTQSRVHEAIALSEKATSDVDLARRSISIATRQAFSATLSSIGQASGLQSAVRSNEAALRAFQRGYEVGVRVNADILEAQARLYEARRDLSRARYDAWINFVKLKAVSGRLAESDLDEIDRLLVSAAPAK